MTVMSPDLRARLESIFTGQYSIEHELGGGGMSRVFVATEIALGRRVVIKLLSAEMTGSVSLQRFDREIRLAAALQQANIVPVLSAGAADGVPYYTMPFVEGLSLRARLEQEARPPLSDTLNILRDVARALAYAHEQGVVHRDIKPENILLSGGTAAVTDFGIAKALANSRMPSGKQESVTQTGTAVGTPAYMAPEQISSDSTIDHRADLYAFGCLAYELLAGRAPFGGRGIHALFAAHLSEQPAHVGGQRPECPAALARMVMRCLEKEPAARPQSAQEILATLDTVSTSATPFERFRHRLTRGQRFGASALLVMIALGGAAFAVRAGVIGGGGRVQSVAVLPLATFSSDADHLFFADGLHEALITELSKLSGLRRVTARGSVMRYKATDKSLTQVARELGVQALITGSVQHSGDRVRVTAQLINASNEELLWSQQYNRERRELLALQDDIVAAITREIDVELTPQEVQQRATTRSLNPDAYAAYLTGRFHADKGTAASMGTALSYFQSALEKEPDFALAYVGIATVWWMRGNMLFTPLAEAHQRAKSAALKAIALDPRLAEGHEVLARIHLWHEWDYLAAEKEFLRAIELNPNKADVHRWYAVLLMTQGQTQKAQAELTKASELDPLNAAIRLQRAYHIGQMRRYDEAIAEADTLIAMWSDPAEEEFPRWIRWRALHQKGLYKEALAEARLIYAADPEILAALSRGYAKGGYAEANALAARALSQRKSPIFADVENSAIFFAFAGRKEEALDRLQDAYDRHHAMMSFIAIDPHWDSLRAELRFQEFMRKLQLPAIWPLGAR